MITRFHILFFTLFIPFCFGNEVVLPCGIGGTLGNSVALQTFHLELNLSSLFELSPASSSIQFGPLSRPLQPSLSPNETRHFYFFASGEVDLGTQLPEKGKGEENVYFRLDIDGQLCQFWTFPCEDEGVKQMEWLDKVPWKTRVVSVEFSVIERNQGDEADGRGKVLGQTSTMYFAPLTDRKGRWRWGWNDKLHVGEALMRAVEMGRDVFGRLDINLLDPVAIAASSDYTPPSKNLMHPFAPFNSSLDVEISFPSGQAESRNGSEAIPHKQHRSLFAHSELLALKSRFFAALLMHTPGHHLPHELNQNSTAEAERTGWTFPSFVFPPHVMLGVLHYIYHEEIPPKLITSDFPALLDAALYFRIERMEVYVVIEYLRLAWKQPQLQRDVHLAVQVRTNMDRMVDKLATALELAKNKKRGLDVSVCLRKALAGTVTAVAFAGLVWLASQLQCSTL
jgi:hypothetical protein